MYNYKSVFSACLLAFLLSCSGNFEPIPSGSRAGASSSSVENYSSTEEPSSSSADYEDESSSSAKVSSSSADKSSSSAAKCWETNYNPSKQFCDNRDGTIYSYVEIGSLVWMAENLNFDKSEGTACCECDKYGRLYIWNSASGVCPTDWRLPTIYDWHDLMKSFNNNNCAHDNYDCILINVGKYLKSSYWGGEDPLGFSALPGGFYYNKCSEIENEGHWLSITNDFADSTKAYYVKLGQTDDAIKFSLSKSYFYYASVRCVKDKQ
jgi:uncharacterized protein (TIGR02145 family)